MPMYQSGNDNTGKLPIVRRGEPLDTWLRRAVLALVQMRGMDETEARAVATEAWSRVNGGATFAGDQQPPTGAVDEMDGENSQGAPAEDAAQQGQQQAPAQPQPKPAAAPQQAQQQQAPEHQAPAQPAAQKPAQPQQAPAQPKPSQPHQAPAQKPAEPAPQHAPQPKPSQPQSAPAQPAAQKPAQPQQQAPAQQQAPKPAPAQPAAAMDWEQSDSWDAAQPGQQQQMHQAPAQMGQEPGMQDDLNPNAGLAGHDEWGGPGDAIPEADNLPEWFANQLYSFADLLADHLLNNGYCDERQAQELMMAASSLSDDFHVTVNTRLQTPQVSNFSFTVPLPTPDQFFGGAGDNGANMPVKGGSGSGYHAPHAGRKGEHGGSAPRGGDAPAPAGAPKTSEYKYSHSPDREAELQAQEDAQRLDAARGSAVERGFNDELDIAEDKIMGDINRSLDEYGAANEEKPGEIGFTYQPLTHDSPTTGYALSIHPERGKTFDIFTVTPEDIEIYLKENMDMWADPKNHIGGWLDVDTDQFYLDVSVVVDTPEEAAALAKKHKERAYFDLQKLESVYVTSVEEHQAKRNELAAVPVKSMVESWFRTRGISGPYVKTFPTKHSPFADQLAIKSLKKDRVGAYLCVWGDPAKKDLSGEWFDRDTEEMTAIFDSVGVVPAIYHHAMDDTVKSTVVGLVDVMVKDDVGLWVEAQIKEHEAYKRFIEPLVSRNVLGWSSGALPGARRVNKATGKITRWPIVEASMTPTPMEWRMATSWPIQNIKGIYRLAGLPADVVDGLLKPGEAVSSEIEKELELIRLVELASI